MKRFLLLLLGACAAALLAWRVTRDEDRLQVPLPPEGGEGERQGPT